MDNSTNSTSDGNNSNNNSNGGTDIVNWVALVVSLVALLGTAAQVLQQYYSSAAGYANCGESVMGEWHNSKKRIFRLTELRFEVQFESPVIFVSFPANKNGPVKNEPIHYVDGTQESLKNTRALLPNQEEKHRHTLQNNRVHTADNERATWVTLLSQLQSMEKESQEWQKQQHNSGPPLPRLADFSQHSLAVAVQAKKRSWDTMPTDVRKPYATTTFCHLLEIAAMMGIYWKEFSRSKDRYRAEGNGYILTGSPIADLGLIFTFRICGKSRFKENRVIPVDEVKEFSFGFVSTIFKENQDNRRLDFPNEDSHDLGFLQLGSLDEVAETMVQIECNTNTANFFRSKDAKHTHLFAVPFELLGMLSKTLHIKNSCFRMLPNPTPYHWDKNFFSLRKLVKEYKTRITDSDNAGHKDALPRTAQIQELGELADSVLVALKHDKRPPEAPGYSMQLLNTMHDALDKCDIYLKASNRDLVRMVLREHFQEVMKMINDDDDDDDNHVDGDTDDTLGTTGKGHARRFDELSAASPEERQEKFMDIYFYIVLDQVRRRAVTSFNRRRSTRYTPSIHARESSLDSVHSGTKAASAPPSPSLAGETLPHHPSPPPLALHERTKSGQSVPLLQIHSPTNARRSPSSMTTDDLDTQATTIWCTLVFRMLCWLMLHDFHKKDVQIAKSELLGSRLPVYIA
ncbi:hypothetical protein B0T22DRAFT_33188 [Podospora appendiculata]|uniref:Modin n=1 Tax=Podospora appendiculata TaxID=314037 RepID=A0AAE1CFV7_9PEZI|nr:hypothetical protein B0T22DRAFT_33188 [Podospora appendiculata]